VQNRAAQRRFRERRDEQNRTLREKAEQLQERYEALGERLNAKSDEVNQLEKKNGELNSEIQDLRRRWRTMVLLLQRPKSLQFLSMFVGDAGLPLDQLDGYVRCLDALIFPEKS
jgi:predicted nuclease with TOPRIM domain